MRFDRNIVRAAMALMLLLGGSVACAAPPEPLIVTRLPDPDPNYIAPPPDPQGSDRRTDDADDSQSIDQAMQTFGRAMGQATLLVREKAAARCQDRIPADASAEQRYAWEASCRYQRY
jgi:hypothetical protein